MTRSGLVHAGFHYNPAMTPRIAILFVASGLACTTAWGVTSGPPAALHETQGTVQAAYAEGLSLDEAVARAERRFDARVVRAEEKRRDGRRVYRIRLLSSDGRVFDVLVDAETGRIE